MTGTNQRVWAPGLVAIAAVLLSGCAIHSHRSTGRGRSAGGTGDGVGPLASSYRIPHNAPTGTVYVMSIGPEQFASGQGEPVYLHVRLAVENQADDVPWTIDSRDQMVSLGGGQTQAPTYARDAGDQGMMTLARGKRGEMDLWYLLQGGQEPARVSLSWQIKRRDQIFVEQTVFERGQSADSAYDEDESYYYYYRPFMSPGIAVGVGAGWWWGSYWGWGWGGYPYWGGYPGYYYPYNRGGYWGGGYYGGGRGRGGGYSAPSGGSRGGGSRGGYGGGSPGGSSGGGRSVRGAPVRR